MAENDIIADVYSQRCKVYRSLHTDELILGINRAAAIFLCFVIFLDMGVVFTIWPTVASLVMWVFLFILNKHDKIMFRTLLTPQLNRVYI